MEPQKLSFKIAVKVRGYVYRMLASWDKFLGRVNPVVILCYHSIADDWRYSVSPDELKKQLYYMSSFYTPVSLADIESFLQGKTYLPPRAFVVTFDDGYEDVYQTKELFQRLGIKPTVFVLSAKRNINRNVLDTNKDFLSIGQIRSLRKSGWLIGSHGATHSVLTNTGKDTLRKEIVESKRKLEAEVKGPVRYFSYPKGRYSQAVMDMVHKAGYGLAVTMDEGFITKATPRMSIPRVGVDYTHTFEEFQALASPSVMAVRGFLKKTPVARYF